MVINCKGGDIKSRIFCNSTSLNILDTVKMDCESACDLMCDTTVMPYFAFIFS